MLEKQLVMPFFLVFFLTLAAAFILAVVMKWKPFKNSGKFVRAFYIGLGFGGFVFLNNRHIAVDEAAYRAILNFVGWFVISYALLLLAALVRKACHPKSAISYPNDLIGSQELLPEKMENPPKIKETHIDLALWELALDEYEQKTYPRGLWAQCFAESNGDEAQVKAIFLKKRVIQLRELNPVNHRL